MVIELPVEEVEPVELLDEALPEPDELPVDVEEEVEPVELLDGAPPEPDVPDEVTSGEHAASARGGVRVARNRANSGFVVIKY